MLTASGLCVVIAVAARLLLLCAQRLLTPWTVAVREGTTLHTWSWLTISAHVDGDNRHPATGFEQHLVLNRPSAC
ncbi:hypothetical protein GCM10018966_036740 [Streptomyces yanii]